MIHYADNTTRQQVYDMWKTVFGDSDEYMEIYFREKYRNENTLIYFESGKAVSSLQMLPFDFSFHGSEIPVAYFSGLCTLPEARKKGFMGA
ncbi:MAG TPA: GNAT family N-acetyltransferase, partial [Petrimonas sp.]|nr:GNAT family N-acetyltransferase [Petrimonas sp.]